MLFKRAHSAFVTNIESIATVTLAFNEFARACAEAGPPYCAIATANSSQADIAAWLWNFVDFAHDHPLGTTTSALARGESLYYYILSACIG